MAHDANDFFPVDDGHRSAGSGDVTVQELTWAMFDEQINNDEFQLLESLLLSDVAARSEYLDCVQLHTDLLVHFARPVVETPPGKSPVLGFLHESVPPFGVQPSPQ